jgi:hypothetical protein
MFKRSKPQVTDDMDVQLVVRHEDPSDPAVGVNVRGPKFRPVAATKSCDEAGMLLARKLIAGASSVK